MAKTTGPLFSVEAHGTIGNSISYQKGSGGNRVTIKPVHRDAQSAGQLSNRSTYQSGVAAWHNLHVHSKEFYNYLGEQLSMTGFNYAMAHYMEYGWM